MPSWLPNTITVLRIALVPLFLAFARAGQRAHAEGAAVDVERWAACAVLVAIGTSDLVDGYLARRHGLVTRAGAWLDAFADKLAQVALLTFFSLWAAPPFPAVPVWFLLVVLGRDLVVTAGTLTVRRVAGHVRVEHRGHGKAATALIFLLLGGVTLGMRADWVLWSARALAVLVVANTALYVRDGFAQVGAASVGQG